MTATFSSDATVRTSSHLPLVRNRIVECREQNANNNSTKRPENLAYLVVHKTSLAVFDAVANPHPVPNALLDGPALAGRFSNKHLGTGGLIPYEILIRADAAATAEQLLPLYARGAHAIGHNWCSIAVAVVCQDELPNPPLTDAQRRRLCDVCEALVPLGKGLKIVGHTDLPGASADPRKTCPGSGFDLPSVAAMTMQKLPDEWQTWSLEQREIWASRDGFQLI